MSGKEEESREEEEGDTDTHYKDEGGTSEGEKRESESVGKECVEGREECLLIRLEVRSEKRRGK